MACCSPAGTDAASGRARNTSSSYFEAPAGAASVARLTSAPRVPTMSFLHASSFDKMARFCKGDPGPRASRSAQNPQHRQSGRQRQLRDLFAAPPWMYTGLDVAAGPNVDVVLRTPYAWREVASASANVVVSGQALEHIPYLWITMLEIARVLKVGGLCCILDPSSGP